MSRHAHDIYSRMVYNRTETRYTVYIMMNGEF